MMMDERQLKILVAAILASGAPADTHPTHIERRATQLIETVDAQNPTLAEDFGPNGIELQRARRDAAIAAKDPYACTLVEDVQAGAARQAHAYVPQICTCGHAKLRHEVTTNGSCCAAGCQCQVFTDQITGPSQPAPKILQRDERKLWRGVKGEEGV